MAPANQAAELAQLTGLGPRGPMVIGRFQGFPAAVHFYDMMNNGQVIFQLKLRAAAVPALAALLGDKAAIESVGLTPSMTRLDGDLALLSYTVMPKMRSVKAQDALASLQGLVALSLRAGPPLGELCSTCEQSPGVPMAINGRIYQLCRTCYDRLAAEFMQVSSVVAAQKPNTRKGLLFGALGMLAGALLWAAVGLATGYQVGLIALVFGYMIGYLIQRGAGFVNNTLIALSVAFSILATVLGFVFYVLFIILNLGLPVSLLPAAISFALASGGGQDVAFGLFLGALGAWGAASQLRRAKASQKVTFDVVS